MSDDEEFHDHPHSLLPSDPELRVKTLESLLVDKGLVDTSALEAYIQVYSEEVGPMNGARVVARTWSDPKYRTRLLMDGTAAIGELGYGGRQGEHVKIVENRQDLHNVVVCTLCSCYPWALLGLPPAWYKSSAYRARVVREPRAVLQEFGLDLPEDVEVRVWDSTSEMRYLVLPERPEGSEGLLEEDLSRLVTRDAMIGVTKALQPGRVGQ